MPALRKHLRGLGAALLGGALLIGHAGCDVGATIELDAAFFIGNWQLENVRDQDGARDRTHEVNQVVEAFRITFHAAGNFDLLISYREETHIPAVRLAGTYAVSPAGQLILTANDIPLAFQATAQGENQVELRAPAAIVNPILGGTILEEITLVGTVVLILSRGGPGA